MASDNLRALIERIEAASVPDFALGVEVLRAVGRSIGDVNPLFSLDAAVSLVPAGWGWTVSTCCGGQPCAYGHPPGMHKIAKAWVDDMPAATPALAACAFALRARIAEMEKTYD